jgi:sulfite reductase beta subunit-like hemoprotein
MIAEKVGSVDTLALVAERDELDVYEEQIGKYRAGLLDETKMQKWRLQFGTYAQRQEGVQMQRMKIPGGFLTADQLHALAEAADRYASGFMHFTTREDAQLYYIKLDETPAMLRLLAEAGITSREACGNTVRNITACHRAGTAPDEAFDVWPYAESLFRYLVRSKYNQNLGRKFKIAFEGCAEDHSALRIHDIGFHAVTRTEAGRERRGFRVYLGGGLGGAPLEARLYTDFLPVDEIYGFATALLRVFDRYGERKSRMKARMKFLVQTMGWDALVEALDRERELVGDVSFAEEDAVETIRREPSIEANGRALRPLDPRTQSEEFKVWARDAVNSHRRPGLRGVNVRIKLGDLTSDRARGLAEVARRFSAGEMRVTIEQNLYLPWVREEELADLYFALREVSLGDAGAGTVTDVTACPGADTCRLGIASARGLATAVSMAFDGPLAEYRELARDLKVKVSGCPNGCAQHAAAGIGFQAAALARDGRTVPAHMLLVGGRVDLDGAKFGKLLGKYPAKNCVPAIGALLDLYRAEGGAGEDFSGFIARADDKRLKSLLAPWREIPSFEADPSFYEDYGHENERFAVRPSLVGECAGSTIAETVPQIETAREWLAQGEAYFYHHEYEHVGIAAYEAAAAAARVPLYKRLVDPFTSAEALWEFENIFVLSGETNGAWTNLAERFERLRRESSDEASARVILDETREFLEYCWQQVSEGSSPK